MNAYRKIGQNTMFFKQTDWSLDAHHFLLKWPLTYRTYQNYTNPITTRSIVMLQLLPHKCILQICHYPQ